MPFWSGNKIGLSVGQSHISIAVGRRRGESVVVKRYGMEAVSPGVCRPSPIEKNITDFPQWKRQVESLLKEFPSVRKLALSVPDSAARILLLDLERLPESRKDFEKLIQWHMEKNFLYNLGDSRFSYQTLSRSGSGWKVLATAIKREVIEQYELLDGRIEICRVGLSSLYAFNLFSSVIAKSAGENSDFVFAHLFDQCFTVFIFKGGVLDFIRVKELPERGAAPDQRSNLLFEELVSSLSFYGEKGVESLTRLYLLFDTPAPNIESRLGENFNFQSISLDPMEVIQWNAPNPGKASVSAAVVAATAAAIAE